MDARTLCRREWIRAILLAPLIEATRGDGETVEPSLAVTMDDPHREETPRLSWRERNDAILSTLDDAGVQAGLFVCGRRVDHPAGREILETWNAAGHLLANHSYSHLYYHDAVVTAEQYIEDARRGERLLGSLSGFRKLYRYPFLKEGDTLEERDRFRDYLEDEGYRVGQVTIDASDWYVDQRLHARLAAEPDADLAPYRDFYLAHLWERASFYDRLSVDLLGRSVPHTLLIHHSLLNALFLRDVLTLFRERGWRLRDAESVYRDPIFERLPDILPAGESFVWALAKQTGRFDDRLRYPGEDGAYEEQEMDRLGL